MLELSLEPKAAYWLKEDFILWYETSDKETSHEELLAFIRKAEP